MYTGENSKIIAITLHENKTFKGSFPPELK